MSDPALNSTVGGKAGFASTQWGALLLSVAGGSGETDAVAAQAAWEHLYRTYCYPIYAFIRRRGHPRQEAQDLTQNFFLHLVETTVCAALIPARDVSAVSCSAR